MLSKIPIKGKFTSFHVDAIFPLPINKYELSPPPPTVRPVICMDIYTHMYAYSIHVCI